MSTTKNIGPKVTVTLNKFLPLAIVNAIKRDARGTVILIDSTQESPELIWNDDMKKEIGSFIGKMTDTFHKKTNK